MFRRTILFAIIIIFGVVIAVSAGDFYWNKNEAGLAYAPEGPTDEELKKQIGQMIIMGFRGTEADGNSDVYKIIKDVQIGGVVLFDYDIPSNSFPRNIVNAEQVKKLISDIQEYSKTPLFVSVDAEGGNVNRLKEKYGFLPVLSAEEMGKDKTSETTKKESAKLAEELKNLGFNMNLAPVVDLNINPDNPVIGKLGRSFSADANEVIEQAGIFIKKHAENNIITVEKHFPGQGSAKNDTHLGMADVTDFYEQEELIPYQKLNDEGLLDAVMAAHTINKKVDDKYPASISDNFLQGVLRNQIGFKGVIISDDMQMSAISDNYGFNEALIASINAGTDIIIISNNTSSGYDKDIARKSADIIFKAVKEGEIDKNRIAESYGRIISLKKKFKII